MSSRLLFVLAGVLIATGCGSSGGDRGPVILSVDPDRGTPDGGEVVTVTTRRFRDDFQVFLPEVLFGSTAAATVTAVSEDTVEAIAPPSAVEESVDVTVRGTFRQQEATRVDAYSYETPPVVAAVIPNWGDPGGGEVVEVRTAHFRDDLRIHTPRVYFGSQRAPGVTVTPAGVIQAVTPPGPADTWVDATVESTGHVQTATLSDGFLYCTSPPLIHDVTMIGEVVPLPTASVIYVLDRGNSMNQPANPWVDRFGNPATGSRWERVADETLESISLLDDTVLFNIYTFACDRESFAPAMVAATPANKVAAETYVLAVNPIGGTGTGPAGARALGETSNRTLLLVTDGEPNCGATGTAGHRDMILGANIQAAQIHTVGIADTGIFADFLKEIAQATGGIYIHVQ